jgi:hypothetical protein
MPTDSASHQRETDVVGHDERGDDPAFGRCVQNRDDPGPSKEGGVERDDRPVLTGRGAVISLSFVPAACEVDGTGDWRRMSADSGSAHRAAESSAICDGADRDGGLRLS